MWCVRQVGRHLQVLWLLVGVLLQQGVPACALAGSQGGLPCGAQLSACECVCEGVCSTSEVQGSVVHVANDRTVWPLRSRRRSPSRRDKRRPPTVAQFAASMTKYVRTGYVHKNGTCRRAAASSAPSARPPPRREGGTGLAEDKEVEVWWR